MHTTNLCMYLIFSMLQAIFRSKTHKMSFCNVDTFWCCRNSFATCNIYLRSYSTVINIGRWYIDRCTHRCSHQWIFQHPIICLFHVWKRFSHTGEWPACWCIHTVFKQWMNDDDGTFIGCLNTLRLEIRQSIREGIGIWFFVMVKGSLVIYWSKCKERYSVMGCNLPQSASRSAQGSSSGIWLLPIGPEY